MSFFELGLLKAALRRSSRSARADRDAPQGDVGLRDKARRGLS
jgi:hypothetical protein